MKPCNRELGGADRSHVPENRKPHIRRIYIIHAQSTDTVPGTAGRSQLVSQAVVWYAGATVQQIERAIAKAANLEEGAIELRDGAFGDILWTVGTVFWFQKTDI